MRVDVVTVVLSERGALGVCVLEIMLKSSSYWSNLILSEVISSIFVNQSPRIKCVFS